MTPALLDAVVDRLAGASIAIALMAAIAWLACRLRPSIAPATRTAIWWLVAAAALLRLAPVPALTIEVPAAWDVRAMLPTSPSIAATAPVPAVATAPAAVPSAAAPRPIAATPFVPLATEPPHAAAATTPPPPADWRRPLVVLWAGIAFALLVHLGVATRRLRALVAAADQAPADLEAEAAALAEALGLRRAPPIRVSESVQTPQVLGVLRPTVLLPAETLATLTPRERTMTLCHELVHVRRRDLTFAWAPAVMERLLFFHPAARLAAREYDVAREAACDAEVLQHLGEAPRDYGRLLLRIGVTRRPAALAVAQSSPSTRLLRRRLAMLNDHAAPARPARGLWLAGACVAVLAMPLSLVARQDDIPPPPPAPPAPPAAAAPVAPPAPPAIPKPASLAAIPPPPAPPATPAPPRLGPTGGIAGGVSGGVPGGIDDDQEPPPPPPPPPPAPARAKMPPPPPPPPPPPADAQYYVGDHGDAWVLLDGKGTQVFSGSRRDGEEARRLRGADGGPILYFRSNGQAYFSRDRALIDRVKAEMKAQQELGAEQAALGAQQAALGAEQAKLGSQQGAYGARQLEFAAATAARHMAQISQIGALEGALVALETGREAQTADILEARKALKDAIAALERARRNAVDTGGLSEEARAKADRMREVEAMQRDLARQQATLGAKQAELGRLQAELGAKQRAVWDAARQRIRVILKDARDNGQVQPVK